ncbi:MAG: hypothetical protein ACR2HF_03785 [Methylococcaceae bacterium]
MPVDLTTLTTNISDGLSSVLNALANPTDAISTVTSAVTDAGSTTGATATTGTGLSLFVKTSPLALVTANPVLILAALGGGLCVIGLIDAISDFRENRRNNLMSSAPQPEQVQKA